MKHATLRQLKTFETVARRMSFSRAAEELFLTQPAVSIQVKQLEEHFGIQLFEHVGRRIVLTPAGREMLGHARTIIDNFRAAEEAMSRAQGTSHNVVRIGVEAAGRYVFPRVIAAYTDRRDPIEFDLAVLEREELITRVSAGELDLAIITDAPATLGVESRAFAPHPYVMVASVDHRLSHRTQMTADELDNEPLIAHPRNAQTRELMESVLIGHPERFKPSMEIADTEAIKQFVAAQRGIGFLSAHAVSLEVSSGVLAVLDVVNFPHVAQWHIAHRSDDALAPDAQEFRRFLLKEGARAMSHSSRVERQLPVAELA